MTKTSDALEPQTSGTSSSTFELVGEVAAALLGRGDFPQIDSDAISARILEQMLRAETPEQLNNVGGTTPMEELEGVPLEVNEVMARQSRLAGEGLAGFLVVSATRLDDGSAVIFTTSAYNVAMRIAIAADKGFVPGYKLKVRRSEQETERGFYPYVVENL